ncbi:hypothetical protein EHM92_01140 [bacterium]|nr:MAG: hypothetical protein EHM92_01140 [bacterium]
MQSDELFFLIIIVLLAGIVLWYLLQRRNTSARIRLSRAEAINRLIDKFATAKEVIEFLETDQGEKFLEDPVPLAENPHNRILRFLQFGVVFLFVGIGFFVNAYGLGFAADLNSLREATEQRFWGTFSVAIGLGLLLVAYLTSVLVKRWHLENGHTVSKPM